MHHLGLQELCGPWSRIVTITSSWSVRAVLGQVFVRKFG
uniref:Uncharacterized protein n=1 Tax=Arundo donax TaxID=35708 RepID=A0A0A9UBF1_ARUDO